jgi:hypothetical protein
MRDVRRILPVALGVVTGLLALAPGAHGATPRANALYEGPETRDERKVRSVSLQMSSSVRRIRYLNATYYRGCRVPGRTGVGQLGLVGLRNVRVSADGRFSYRRMRRYPNTGGFEELRVSGRFVGDGTRFVATVRGRLSNPQSRARCDSKTKSFSGRIPDRQLVNGSWSGTTDQGAALRFRVDSRGVRALEFDVAAPCADGSVLGGRFTMGASDALPLDRERLEFRGGASGTGADGLEIVTRGDLTPGGATGTITATGFKTSGDDASVRCEATIGWSARRATR